MAEDIVDILVTNYNDSVTVDIQPNVTVINISNLAGLSGIIVPSGTVGKIPYYDTTSTFADSNIFTDGTSIGINNPTPTFYSTNRGLVLRNGTGNVEMILQHDGNTAASIQGLSISNVKTDAAYIFNRENLPLKFGTNDLPRVTILGNGNVGIATSTPQGIFEAVGLSYFTRASQSILINPNYGGSNTHAQVQVAGNIALAFATNGDNERLRITNSGKALVGTTTDNGDYLLQVNSQIWATNATIATSDVRLKDNIFDLGNSLELLMSIKPRTFTYRQDMGYNFGENGVTTGFIAQELLQVLGSKDYASSVVKESGPYYGVAYEKLIPILVKSIQELKLELDTLKQ